jgi:hypothetical protein
MPDQAFGDDLDHELVGVVDAPAAVEGQRQGERGRLDRRTRAFPRGAAVSSGLRMEQERKLF